jgi:1-acyl-sn-glycerol-3-phosphate acyltransferase
VAGWRLGFWRRFAVVVAKPVMTVLTRRTWRGMEHVPVSGAAVVVVNHTSHADPLVAAHFLYDSGRWPQFLAKASVFEVPVVGWLLTQVRQIPVRRGTADAARALDAAMDAVKAGEAVVIYPEGTTTKQPELWPMRGKTGAARLALTTGAPVIPMVTWGAAQIFDPRTGKLHLRPRMPVTVVAGPPLDLSRWAGAEPSTATLYEVTDEIMVRLSDMLADIRGGSAPPLWSPAGRDDAAEEAGEAEAARETAEAGDTGTDSNPLAKTDRPVRRSAEPQ